MYDLKDSKRHFPSKYRKINFSNVYRFREILGHKKIFPARYFVAVSQHFWWDQWKMKDNTIWHIAMKRKVNILPRGSEIHLNIKVCSMIQHFGEFPVPIGEMSTFLFIAMCQIVLSFICHHRSRLKMLRDGNKIAR